MVESKRLAILVYTLNHGYGARRAEDFSFSHIRTRRCGPCFWLPRRRGGRKKSRFSGRSVGPTQEYEKRRIQMVLGQVPPNVIYASIDFEKDKLISALEKCQG